MLFLSVAGFNISIYRYKVKFDITGSGWALVGDGRVLVSSVKDECPYVLKPPLRKNTQHL